MQKLQTRLITNEIEMICQNIVKFIRSIRKFKAMLQRLTSFSNNNINYHIVDFDSKTFTDPIIFKAKTTYETTATGTKDAKNCSVEIIGYFLENY